MSTLGVFLWNKEESHGFEEIQAHLNVGLYLYISPTCHKCVYLSEDISQISLYQPDMSQNVCNLTRHVIHCIPKLDCLSMLTYKKMTRYYPGMSQNVCILSRCVTEWLHTSCVCTNIYIQFKQGKHLFTYQRDVSHYLIY